ncbi:MAG: hypothetical protein V3V07_10100 [candidate division NC10 bacterium]
MIEFTKTMLLLPQPWLGWMGLLVAVNMVIPLYYIHTREAKVVLIAAMFGLMIMMAIFGAKGFVRLLGIGHITWVPMLPWLWTRLDDTSFGSFFGYWLIAVIVLDSLSLIVDVVDIRRYIKGERTPHLALNA